MRKNSQRDRKKEKNEERERVWEEIGRKGQRQKNRNGEIKAKTQRNQQSERKTHRKRDMGYSQR